MNAQAILTPGGIADQLTRGLSGLGQSFNDREEMLRRGQRDRIGDDRYTAEMALRQQRLDREDARQALMDRRYGDERRYSHARDALGDRRTAESEAAARQDREYQRQDAERKRQSLYPEDYASSPSPQVARTAQEALNRREFSDAKSGYIPQDKMIGGFQGRDWREPMVPNEQVYGPKPGSPAAQGQAAGDALRRPVRDYQAEIRLRDSLRDDVPAKPEDAPKNARNTLKVLEPQIANLQSRATLLDPTIPEQAAELQQIQIDLPKLQAAVRDLNAQLMPGGAPPAGGDWKQRAANGFKQFVTP